MGSGPPAPRAAVAAEKPEVMSLQRMNEKGESGRGDRGGESGGREGNPRRLLCEPREENSTFFPLKPPPSPGRLLQLGRDVVFDIFSLSSVNCQNFGCSAYRRSPFPPSLLDFLGKISGSGLSCHVFEEKFIFFGGKSVDSDSLSTRPPLSERP